MEEPGLGNAGDWMVDGVLEEPQGDIQRTGPYRPVNALHRYLER